MILTVSLVHFYMRVGGKVACLLCVEIIFHTPLDVFYLKSRTLLFLFRPVMLVPGVNVSTQTPDRTNTLN